MKISDVLLAQKRHYKLFIVCIVQYLLTSCQALTESKVNVISIQSDFPHPVSTVINHSLVPLKSITEAEQLVAFTNINIIKQIIADNHGYLWTASSGGVVQWYPQDGGYQKYTILDGLPDNTISAIGIDNHNQIWAGTYNGYICRYDGHNWIAQYPKIEEIITSFAFAKDDTLWVGTNRGIFHYDGNQWVLYTTKQGLLDNYIQSLLITSNGTVWVGLIGGISSFDGISWKSRRLIKGSVVGQIIESQDNSIWFSAENKLFHMSGNELFTYQIDSSFKNITAIVIDHKGKIWISDGKNMIGIFDEEKRSFVPYSIPNISSMVIDQTDNLWLGSFRAGISKFDEYQQDIYHTEEDLIDNFVLSSAKGTDGSLWFGTYCGVSQFDGNNWHSFTTKDGLINNSVHAIAASPDGSIWFGTEDGTSRFDGNTWRNYDIKDGLPDKQIASIAVASDGSVWVISKSGISKFTEGEWRPVYLPVELSNSSVQPITTGKDGQVWIGTHNGFVFLDGNRWVVVDIGSNAPVTSIAISEQGDLWLGTLQSGIIYLSNVFWEQVLTQLPSDPVSNIEFNSDTSVSIQNNGGNFIISGVTWQHFTKSNGLSDESIYFILIDQIGPVWVATKSGVSKILDFHVVPYLGEPSLGNRKVQTIVQDQSGNIWFGIILKGLISLRP
jgi:ligand-binding sensor domain-containing protein